MVEKHKNNPFHQYLMDDEEIVWSDQPELLQFHTDCGSLMGYLFMTVFTLIWSGLTYIGTVALLMKGWYLILLLPHFWIGYWLFPGRFIGMYIQQRQRKNSYYALTDKRILILNRLGYETLISMYLEKVSDVKLNNSAGTIAIKGYSEQHKGKDSKGQKKTLKLEHISRAHRVYQDILALRAEAVDKKRQYERFIYDADIYEEKQKVAKKGKKGLFP